MGQPRNIRARRKKRIRPPYKPGMPTSWSRDNVRGYSGRTLVLTWLQPLLLIAVMASALVILGNTLDRYLLSQNLLDNPLFTYTTPDSQDDARALLTSLIEFLAALVGLGLTVATILVQLSANRYSSRVIDLFIADRVNLGFFGLTIITPLYTFWVVNIMDHLPYPSSHIFIIQVLISLNMLLLIPYVNHLFRLLKPEAIISRIQSTAELSRLTRSESTGHIDRMREDIVTSVNQLTDIILNSLNSSDLNLALRTVVAIREMVNGCLHFKDRAPATWFEPPPTAYLGLAAQQFKRMSNHQTWVEMHSLKSLELIFVQSLNRFQELTTAVVQRTSEIGITAYSLRHLDSVNLCILFMNTYLRHAMNAKDLRTIFHTFHQYRLLGEHCATDGEFDILKRIAFYFKYYGQQCEKKGLGFAIEITAFDLRLLVEHAYKLESKSIDEMLKTFLEVDREPGDETETLDVSQRGVRKSQALLAAFLLFHEDETRARLIYEDMSSEKTERLQSIAVELAASSAAEFWEIQERGANFYYLPDELRPHLDTYFSWFSPSPPSP